MVGYYENKDALRVRLRRIEGQVRGLQRLVDEDTYCIDILTQISAVTAGLHKVALSLLEDHLGHCVADGIAGGEDADAKVREATAAVQRLLRGVNAMLDAIWHALDLALGMTWEILWALIVGFALSAVVQSVVSKREMTRLLPDDSPRTLAVACGLGAASSSCSYAAVALARSLFRKGANFTSAMAFQFASTNLVIELGVILWLLIGWQFTLAEFVGGFVMIAILAAVFRWRLRPSQVETALAQAERGVLGSMEGHAEMDMSVTGGSVLSRILSPRGFTAISHSFVMDWAAVVRDIALGLLIAGAVAAWVPASFWQGFFLVHHPLLAKLWGPLVGPFVAMLSFVCSIGNVPLAAVLWNGGISFGGVIAFIFADLIVLPILSIYRKYYGGRMSLFLLGTFYLTMVLAGFVVEIVFGGLGLVPGGPRDADVVEADITFNYTTVLNIVFLILAAALLIRFFRTGGRQMLAMMDRPAETADAVTSSYVCPMHPDVRSPEPGSCPICGMALVPERALPGSDGHDHHAP